MAASILCTPCQQGDCDNHVKGQTTPGVLGGWLCPCRHLDDEKGRRRAQWEAQIAEKFRLDPAR